MQDIPTTTRQNDQAPRPINESDIDKLVSKIKETDRQLWLTVQLEYYCFLRPGLEIRFARIKWFDLARGVINVPKDLIKTRRDKVVIIPNQFREYLLTDWKLHLFPSDYYLIGQNGFQDRYHLAATISETGLILSATVCNFLKNISCTAGNIPAMPGRLMPIFPFISGKCRMGILLCGAQRSI